MIFEITTSPQMNRKNSLVSKEQTFPIFNLSDVIPVQNFASYLEMSCIATADFKKRREIVYDSVAK